MAGEKRRFERDARKLVECITGFQEDEENFDACLQFALSNFKFHRFLDVDSHKIGRSIDGIHNKFLVHSQEKEAASIKRLTSEFLDAPAFGSKEYGKTDTHYALLSLLLKLADTPTRHSVSEKTETQKEVPKEFDWGAYLLEGEELYKNIPFPDSPIYSDDDDDDDELFVVSGIDDAGDRPRTAPNVSLPHQAAEALRRGAAEGDSWEEGCEEKGGPPSEEVWLRKNVVVQYWQGEREIPQSWHWSANLSTDWESNLSQTSNIYVTAPRRMVTEEQLVREVLWMLSGVSVTVYRLSGEEFHVKEDVYTSHLTTESLYNLLGFLGQYGSQVLQLQNFIQEVTSSGCYGAEPRSGVCQTYQAFAAALSEWMQGFRKELTAMEKTVLQQDCSSTLSSMVDLIQPRLEEVALLHFILVNGIKPYQRHQCNSLKASQILNCIFDALSKCDTMGKDSTRFVTLLFPVWLQTAKPYIDIISNWIMKGNLIDPMREFIVQSNDQMRSLDETFWETAFILNCTLPQDLLPDQSSVSKSSTSQSQSSRETSSNQSKDSKSWAPPFLLPVLEKVILAGKSMEVLQNLGKLWMVVKDSRESVYDSFTERLFSKQDFSQESRHDKHNHSSLSSFTSDIDHQMKIKNTHDPLLQVNFRTILCRRDDTVLPPTCGSETKNRKLGSWDVSGLVPIHLVLESYMYPDISETYEHVCHTLVKVLKEECKLLEDLASMRRFFLMQAGEVMYDFYTELFKKLQFGESWQDISFLNMILQEALQVHYPHLVARLQVNIGASKQKPHNKQPINALDHLSLTFKVPWPVNVVITTQCQNVYNQIFTFLLQIKRAKFCLDGLRFSDLKREDPYGNGDSDGETESLEAPIPKTQLIHRMQLFRTKILHFVNSLHSYLMTRILYTTGLEFDKEMSAASDLDKIITAHNTYMRKIHERCLLHRKVSFLKEAVMKVLNLALIFQHRWNAGANHIRLKSLEQMETEFSRCIQFLSSFLNNVIKRGSFPHLEMLAFSLLTSCGEE